MKRKNLTYFQAINYLSSGFGEKVVYNQPNQNPVIEMIKGKAINTYERYGAAWNCDCGCMKNSLWMLL
jgi:hypothetical protein